ncbi:MAG: DUF1894 domain-containing protein [Methanofollis liminatans]|jgi:hypothetical protein|uniref:DUF1894 domain-containing protein n=2 Tax=Methanofollis TaxID=81416 RepID=A0A7K4HQP9_9EURY|nr:MULTISPECIES: DUF1894 domain-containing protein [Methanofollis]EJG07807.1 Uncharacterized conserved protein UCP006577 [Methanofollis liminatans DSM 4140]MDD3110812.1 DUF1894 domain-containing protein [Methanofollis liminatans]NVO67603.1 DUF1894 domain-containing protein [Methanofollis tationis]
MGCVEALKYEVLLRNCSFREYRDYIRKNYREFYDVMPGYRIFDLALIGVPPIPIGVDGDSVIFPYTKPCHGTFVLKVEGKDEVLRLRSQKK